MSIQEIDRVFVTILIDNSTDLLLTSSAHAIRPPLTKDEKFILPLPVAEHGFSALIIIFIGSDDKKGKNGKTNNKIFLFDTGPSENGVIHNADVFGLHFAEIDGVILSHGHFASRYRHCAYTSRYTPNFLISFFSWLNLMKTYFKSV